MVGSISMSTLGRNGRFANQLVQYAFVKTFAKRHGLRLQLPSWIGNELFGFDEPAATQQLPEFNEADHPDLVDVLMSDRPCTVKDVDFKGFFQVHSSHYHRDREFIQSLFVPKQQFREPLESGIARLRNQKGDLVAIHIRRGDYGYGCFYLTPTDWYVRWLDSIWPRLKNPVLYIATDDPKGAAKPFAKFSPWFARDLSVEMPIAPFYPDFYVLSQADILAIPNSTFSFMASLLNTKLREAWRSHLTDPVEDIPFLEYSPWNAPFLDIHATQDRFPDVPGIWKSKRFRPFKPIRRWLKSLFPTGKKAAS